MKIGLIGYPLGHSWSKEIHAFLLGEDCYTLHECRPEDLETFFRTTDLDGFNVTIPHKQAVIPLLDVIDPAAERIGAVNTVVRRDGKFIGYNTDYEGFIRMLEANGIQIRGRRAAILGSGGVSKAIRAAVGVMEGTYDIVSRRASEDTITYEQMYANESAYSVVINATPVGMSPKEEESPADLTRFSNLEAVVDAIANPLRTALCFQAQELGIPFCGGFEMLVRQAIAADRWFTGHPMDEALAVPCMNHLLKQRRSIVLIGMPTSGKSTIAEQIHAQTGRALVEMDEILTERLGMPISQCFAEKGEAFFRAAESELCKELTSGNAVISCGGGVVKNRNNMQYLSRNGLVFWIDRDPSLLYGSASRPLSQSKEDILRLYEVRKDLYRRYSDIRIENNGSPEEAVRKILRFTGESES
ncbi:MAG: shikimate dehydrogenase [Solobacterium sp.]|nr:shikimate dehydrogenase [Solobacterium sp.]